MVQVSRQASLTVPLPVQEHEPRALSQMSRNHCVSHQIGSVCDACAVLTADLPNSSCTVSSVSFLFPHTKTHADLGFSGKKNKSPHIPLCSQSYSEVSWPVRFLHSFFVIVEFRRGNVWRRANGAPGTRNVNWEDCFNKALISVDAGRGLAGGATQTAGQLTGRYCLQTALTY